ncbi:MAG: glycosyltransferase, partial [Planctomycetota bacterium]
WAASQGSLETSFNPAEAPCRNLPLLFDFQACDAMLTRSRFQMSEAPGWVQERTIVVPDGVDCDAFCPADPNDPVFQCRGLPPDAPTLSYAEERLDPERGFPDFMAAAAQLQARHKDLHVVVAGEDIPRTQVPGEEPTSCRMTTMEQHDFDIPRLHFVGRLAPERYCALLKRSTVHCHLTRACVPAPSLLQAMATGCTLVVTDVAPVREVLPHPASAAFVKPESPREVADAVSTLLADPGFAQEKGRNARMHTLHSYDQRSQHIATEAVLSSIADPGPDGLRFAS